MVRNGSDDSFIAGPGDGADANPTAGADAPSTAASEGGAQGQDAEPAWPATQSTSAWGGPAASSWSPPQNQAPAQAPGWPPAQNPGWPPAQTPGWPPAQSQGWPPAQSQGWPPAQAPGWPPAQNQGWPPAQNQGWQPPAPNTWPPAAAGWAPGYPPVPAGVPQRQAPWLPVQFGPAPGVIWASIGIRIGALVLDLVLMFVLLLVATGLAGAAGYKSYADGSYYYPPAASAIFAIFYIFVGAYFPTTWWAFQGTLGQRLLRLRVVRARDGAAMGIGETTIRYLLWAICVVTVAPGIIAAAMASDNPMRRTWWDDAAGSLVIRRI